MDHFPRPESGAWFVDIKIKTELYTLKYLWSEDMRLAILVSLLYFLKTYPAFSHMLLFSYFLSFSFMDISGFSFKFSVSIK